LEAKKLSEANEVRRAKREHYYDGRKSQDVN